MTKLKNSKCDKKFKKINAIKIKNPKFDKTQKLKMWQNTKTTNVTNSECDKTQNSKFYNSKTKNMTKLKKKIKMWKNLTTQMVTQLISLNCDKTQTKIVTNHIN